MLLVTPVDVAFHSHAIGLRLCCIPSETRVLSWQNGHSVTTAQGGEMSVQLNHTIVWCRDKQKSTRFLMDILQVPSPIEFG